MKKIIVAVIGALAISSSFAQTTFQTIGNQTYINRPNAPAIVCQRIGNMTYCN